MSCRVRSVSKKGLSTPLALTGASKAPSLRLARGTRSPEFRELLARTPSVYTTSALCANASPRVLEEAACGRRRSLGLLAVPAAAARQPCSSAAPGRQKSRGCGQKRPHMSGDKRELILLLARGSEAPGRLCRCWNPGILRIAQAVLAPRGLRSPEPKMAA